MHQYLLTVQQLLEIGGKPLEDELMICHGVRARSGRGEGGSKPFLDMIIICMIWSTLFFNWIYGTRG
jgi:hypothetical protein